METARVDICYRPLRIAWAIHSTDKDGFRQAVCLSHTLWGGRFNPIVMADRPEEARAGSVRLNSSRVSINGVLPGLRGFLPHRGWHEGRA